MVFLMVILIAYHYVQQVKIPNTSKLEILISNQLIKTRSATHVNTPEKKKDVPSWMLILFVLLCPSMPQIII